MNSQPFGEFRRPVCAGVPVVGLTGAIGSGKSTVAEVFASLGVAVVDTDAIAHELTSEQGAAMPQILAEFGSSLALPSGALDRVAMRHLVFSDPEARKRLEAILHPMIFNESDARCRAAEHDSPYVILMVPLLVESSAYRQRVDRILVVECAQEIQIARVMARSHLTSEEVCSILAAQAPRADRLAAADDVLVNAGDLESLRQRIMKLHQRYVGLLCRENNTHDC